MRLAYLISIRLFRQLKRDHRTIGLITVAPIFFIILFGLAFGGEIENIRIVIINEDSDAHVLINQTFTVEMLEFNVTIFNQNISSIGSEIINSLQDSSKVKVFNSSADFDEEKNSIDNKKYVCAILIPVNFTYNLVSPYGENISVELYIDNSNPQVGAVVLQAFQEAFQEATGEFRSNLGIDLQYAYGEGLTTLDFFAPAMIAYATFFFSFILVIMNLIDERKKGTLPLLLQCPYDKIQIILGYLATFSIISMCQTILVIVSCSLLFNVSFGSTIGQYLALCIAGIVVGWSGLVLAIFLSSFARSEFQAVQFIPLVILPALLLSGIVIPLDQIPEIIRWLSDFIPTTYGVRLLRQISIEGLVLTPFNFDLIVQVLFVIALIFGSRLTLRET